MLKSIVLRFSNNLFLLNCQKMSTINGDFLSALRKIPPVMENTRKGDAGRVAIIGGSSEYTGAPYYSAITAFRVGADLVHVFTTHGAASVIKTYSPDLIVHPLLDETDAFTKITRWLKNMDVILIGPGLGRDDPILETVSKLIRFIKEHKLPLVIDADGLYLVSMQTELIEGYPYPGVILTPNIGELERLSNAFGKNSTGDISFERLGPFVSIFKKGLNDSFLCSAKDLTWEISKGGSARRCGGQGDLLSGSLAIFYFWALKYYGNETKNLYPACVASYGASRITRLFNEKAFKEYRRSMIASDMIRKIPEAYEELFT